MGRFIRDCSEVIIEDFLVKQRYSRGESKEEHKGLIKRYLTQYKCRKVHVTFDLNAKKLYIYEEFINGDKVKSEEYTLDEDWFNSVDTFKEEIDRLLEPWIGEE